MKIYFKTIFSYYVNLMNLVNLLMAFTFNQAQKKLPIFYSIYYMYIPFLSTQILKAL